MKNKLASNVVASTAFAIAATFGFAAPMGGPQPGRLAFAPPTVYPNTVDRDTFAQFTTETNPWLFVLLRL